MQDIRTITLDLDDTLWPIAPVIERAERRLYAWLHEHYPRITERFPAPSLLRLRQEIVLEHPDKGHDYYFLRRAVLRHIGEQAGYGSAYIDDAMEVFHAERNAVELYPDVRPSLEALGRHYRIVAVTNGNANLERIGIGDLFDEVVSAANAGVAKPAREIFEVAVEAGGASAHETLHVGDHPEIDVIGASAAGLRAAWINRNGHEWPRQLQQPDAIVRDVGELLAILRGAAT